MNHTKKSGQIAIGGVFSGLCLLVMFLTGLVPFASYALPAVAGAMLVAVVVENGNKVAIMVYVSVSLLSLFVVPDLEARVMFIAFFGYYPVVKGKIEKLTSKVIQWVLKIGLFVGAVSAAYYLMMKVLRIPDILSDMGELGKYGAIALLAAGTFVFILYDVTLSRYTYIYIHHFRKKLRRY